MAVVVPVHLTVRADQMTPFGAMVFMWIFGVGMASILSWIAWLWWRGDL